MSKLGTIQIKETDKVYITDPGYKDGTWCQARINMLPGLYKIYYYTTNDGTISSFKLVHSNINNKNLNFISLDYIGVDAGLCGMFLNKPNYTNEEWIDICTYLERAPYPTALKVTKESPFKCEGFVTSSGYGDGCYSALLGVDTEGNIISCKVKFL